MFRLIQRETALASRGILIPCRPITAVEATRGKVIRIACFPAAASKVNTRSAGSEAGSAQAVQLKCVFSKSSISHRPSEADTPETAAQTAAARNHVLIVFSPDQYGFVEIELSNARLR